MKASFYFPRFVALFLSLSLSLPQPAFALRSEQIKNNDQAAAGLEGKLIADASRFEGKEQPHPPSAPPRLRTAAGLEELKPGDWVFLTGDGAGTGRGVVEAIKLDSPTPTVRIRFDNVPAEPYTLYLEGIRDRLRKIAPETDVHLLEAEDLWKRLQERLRGPVVATVGGWRGALIEEAEKLFKLFKGRSIQELEASGWLQRLADLAVQLELKLSYRNPREKQFEAEYQLYRFAPSAASLQAGRVAIRGKVVQRVMKVALESEGIPGARRLQRLKQGEAVIRRPFRSLADLFRLQKRFKDRELRVVSFKEGAQRSQQAVVLSVGMNRPEGMVKRRLWRSGTAEFHTHRFQTPVRPSHLDSSYAKDTAELGIPSLILSFSRSGEKMRLALYEPGPKGWRYTSDRKEIRRILAEVGILSGAGLEERFGLSERELAGLKYLLGISLEDKGALLPPLPEIVSRLERLLQGEGGLGKRWVPEEFTLTLSLLWKLKPQLEAPRYRRKVGVAIGATAAFALLTLGFTFWYSHHLHEKAFQRDADRIQREADETRNQREAFERQWQELDGGVLLLHLQAGVLPEPIQQLVREKLFISGTQVKISGAIVSPQGESEPIVIEEATIRAIHQRLEDGAYGIEIDVPDRKQLREGSSFEHLFEHPFGSRWLMTFPENFQQVRIEPAGRIDPAAGLEEKSTEGLLKELLEGNPHPVSLQLLQTRQELMRRFISTRSEQERMQILVGLMRELAQRHRHWEGLRGGKTSHGAMRIEAVVEFVRWVTGEPKVSQKVVQALRRLREDPGSGAEVTEAKETLSWLVDSASRLIAWQSFSEKLRPLLAAVAQPLEGTPPVSPAGGPAEAKPAAGLEEASQLLDQANRLAKDGAYEKALLWINRAYEADSSDPKIWISLANILALPRNRNAPGALREALGYVQEALQVRPDSVAALTVRGKVLSLLYLRPREWKRVLDQFGLDRKAIREKAVDSIRQALKLDGEGLLEVQVAVHVFDRLGMWEEAQEVGRSVLKVEPATPEEWFRLAQIHHDLKLYRKARSILMEEVLPYRPDWIPALGLLQELERDLKKPVLTGLEEQDRSERKRNRPTREALQARRQRLAQRLQRRPPPSLEKWTITALADAEDQGWHTIYKDLGALHLLTSDRLELKEMDRPSSEEVEARRQRLTRRLEQKPPSGLKKWTITALAKAEGEDWQTVYHDLSALALLASDRLELQERRRGTAQEDLVRGAGLEEGKEPRSRLAVFLSDPDVESVMPLLARPDRIEDLTEDFPQVREMAMEDGHPAGKVLLVPTTLLPGALEATTLRLFVEEAFEPVVKENVVKAAPGVIQVVRDPSVAHFIIGDKGFIDGIKVKNPSFIPQKVFLVVNRQETARSITAALLFNLESWLASQRDRPAEGWTLTLDDDFQDRNAVRISA